MVLKFYSVSYSAGGCGVVAMVLAELQIPYELVPIDNSKNENKTPEYLAMHPWGQVPLIDDDGFLLYESRAICRYLVEKYGGQGPSLVPTDLKAKALFEQAASIEFANFFPPVHKMCTQTIFNPYLKRPVDEAALEQGKLEFTEKLAVYEVILGKQKYLAGNELTLADLFHLIFTPMLISWGKLDVMADRGPNVTRWWKDITSRPTWIKLQAEGITKSVGV
ncbi:glutathione S-transferase [Mycena belliarum]|uniref:glutathione transferase n=1 Tax=Mycena belliarum TaxID=1033014 RepID=A0AAD6U2B5_9AGAR|nr:glutathione S-transferase [Mycena belliae]